VHHATILRSVHFASVLATLAAAANAATAAARADFDLLNALADKLRWTDDSAVDVALLGPLWPPGEELEWANQSPKDTDIAGLEVTYTVPDDMSDEEAITLMAKAPIFT